MQLQALEGFIKGGRFRERKKALAVLGRLMGIRTAVIARCLKMSRRTIVRYFSRFSNLVIVKPQLHLIRMPPDSLGSSPPMTCSRTHIKLR